MLILRGATTAGAHNFWVLWTPTQTCCVVTSGVPLIGGTHSLCWSYLQEKPRFPSQLPSNNWVLSRLVLIVDAIQVFTC